MNIESKSFLGPFLGVFRAFRYRSGEIIQSGIKVPKIDIVRDALLTEDINACILCFWACVFFWDVWCRVYCSVVAS